MIEIKNLSKTFDTAGGRVEALKNINLTIDDGDIYGIIGMSGAGKSTLVRCINMLERPSEGTVLIDGKDMGALSPGQAADRAAEYYHDLSGLQPAHAEKLPAQCLLSHGIVRGTQGRSKRESHESVESGGSSPEGQGLSGSAFRRTATAGSHCPGVSHQPQGPALRRGDLGLAIPTPPMRYWS